MYMCVVYAQVYVFVYACRGQRRMFDVFSNSFEAGSLAVFGACSFLIVHLFISICL